MAFNLTESRQDRLDNLLYKARKPKLALKEVDRWIAKHPNDELLMYLRSDVLLRCGRVDEAVAILDGLLAKAPPIKTVSLIRSVHDLLFRIQQAKREEQASAGQPMANVWRSALKQQSDRTEVLYQWYDVAVRCNHWEDSQMAVAALRKELPSDETIFYQYIAVTNMAAQALSVSNATRAKIHQTLSLKLLRSIIDQALSNNPSKVSVTKPQEMALVLEIYSSRGEYSDLLSILNSEKLGISSTLLFDKTAMIKQKLKILEIQEQWLELGHFCKYLIDSRTTVLDMEFDWDVFQALCLAMRNSDPSVATELKGFLREYFDQLSEKQRRDRNHLLTYVALPELRLPSGQAGIHADLNELRLQSCESYFKSLGSYPCFLHDLKPYISTMEPRWRLRLLKLLETASEGESRRSQVKDQTAPHFGLRVSALQAKYLIQLSIGHRNEQLYEFLTDFTAECVQVLGNIKSPRQFDCRELVMLLTVALIKLHFVGLNIGSSNHSKPAFQALALLEHHIKAAPEDKEALLMHVCLTRYLGLTTKAIATFLKLRIKGVLTEGVSHILFTRLATLHPFNTEPQDASTVGMSIEDSIAAMATVLAEYIHVAADITGSMVELRKGPIYHTLAQSSILRRKFERSVFRRHVCIEKRRAERFRGVSVDDQGLEDIGPFLDKVSDERDYTIVLNYELDDASNMQWPLLNGPTPGLYWLATMVLWDDTQTLIAQKPSFHPNDIRDAENMVSDATGADRSQLTAVERGLSPAWSDLRLLVSPLGSSPTKGEVEIGKIIGRIKGFVTDLPYRDIVPGSGNWPVPNWFTIHELLAHLEYLRACSKLKGVYLTSGKFRKQSTILSQLQELNDVVAAFQSKLKDCASTWVDKLSPKTGDTLFSLIREDAFGQDLCSFIGTVDVRATLDSVVSNARGSMRSIASAASS